MKENFVFYTVFVIFVFDGCIACFLENSSNNRSVTTGSSFYEECCCTEPGHTVEELQWLDPYNRVIGPIGPGIDSNVFIEEQGDCISLHIPSSGKTMSGAYRCVTIVDSVPHTQTHNLDVYDQVYFYNAPASQFLIHGSDSWITCEANGASPPFIRWYRGKDGQDEISNHTEKYGIFPQGLFVRNVSDSDDGIYKCSASVLSTGEEVEIDIDVKVLTIPVIMEVSASPEKVVVANEQLILQCDAQGLPTPEIEWWKLADTNKDEANDTRVPQRNSSVVFSSIKPADAGAYKCVAKNFIGRATRTVTIEVLEPPEIIDFHNITAIDGTEIAMFCNATGNPLPNVTITFEGKSLEESDSEYEIEVPNYSVLKIDRSCEGIYICNATNDVATKSELMYMTVLHKPFFKEPYEPIWSWNGETINITCTPDSNPPANISWRYLLGNYSTISKEDLMDMDYDSSTEHSFTFSDKFAPYGVHECIAKNELGESNKVYHIRKGFPPTLIQNATVTDRTATSATFSIEPPTSFEGPDVIGFIAEYDTELNYEITNIHPNRTWAIGVPYKLEKLRSNTVYNIRFAAINRVGTGEWSDMIVFDTLAKSAPEPPIWQVDALQISSNKLLKWKAPENNGEPIDYYALRYCPMDVDLDETLCKEHRLEGVNELQVDDLKHNVTYYLELIAHNAEGNSTPANISLTIPAAITSEVALLSGEVLIGISVLVVIICLILLDLLLFFWRKQGILASCCYKKSKKRKPNPLNSRDKKGLLKDNGESGTDDTLRRPNNGHKEYEYNKTTGIITGKHSSV